MRLPDAEAGARNIAAELIARASGGADDPRREESDHAVALLSAALESTADGILVVNARGRIVTCNRKFVEMWRLPDELVAGGDQREVIAFVLDQLRDPEGFAERVRELYADPTAEARDVVEFADGRAFERYSQPQRVDGKIVGRVSSFRDVTELRRTEAALERRAEQAARFQEALVRLARSRAGDLDSALSTIVETDASTLGVNRVSVWLFNADGSQLVCRTLHAPADPVQAEIPALRADDLPDYFRALRERRVIAAVDAAADPATHEFAESYLVPLGIASMLDVPIWRVGSMVGVVCHEHIGERRQWTVEEQDFAASIADMVSLALEASDRRKAEAALRASEASYRAIFELSNDAICVHDVETGEILDANRAACAMHGYEAEEMRRLGIAALSAGTPASTRQMVMESFERAARGEPQRVEWKARHGSGREFWQEVDLQLVTIGGKERILSTARDITARKEAEDVLRRSHEELERLVAERTRELREKSSELEAVFHALPDLYFRLDAEGRFLDFRAGQSSNLFADPSEFLGRRIQDVLPPEAARLLADGLAEVARTRDLVCVEYTLPLQTGEHAFEARILPFSDGQTITIVRDITEQQAVERELKRREEHFRLMTENSSDVASILDMRGISIYHSPAMERVLGYKVEEIVGSSSFERIHPDDHETCRQVLGAMFRSPGTTHTVVFRYRHRDGSWRFVEVHGRTLLADSPEGGVIINLRDITERKAVEEALKAAKVEADEANRAKSEFLSRMSHELRTPMNSILGFGQLLARQQLTPDQSRGVDHILKAGRHLLNLINEVLDLARIEANRQQLSLEPVLAGSAVEEALSLIRPLAVQRGCRLQEPVEIPEVYVRADRQRLTQVMLNLLSNAVKYNRPGGTVAVVWEQLPGGDRARGRIGVRDTGPGIPREDVGRIFAPFERLGAERTGEEGTGLGLALSRRLVEAMDGTLTVESVPGEGSTFWTELDVVIGPLERLAANEGRAGAPASAAGTLPRATILYIEDNLANLTLVETILAMEPALTVIPALQGQLGHELAVEHRPDLILLDLHLPDIPGTEVLRRLQEHPATRDIPVVVISADAMGGTIESLMRSGARAYLTKPLDVDQFLDTVLKTLAERRRR